MGKSGVLASVVFAVLAVACSASVPSQQEHSSSVREAVIKGTPSGNSQDAVVLLVHYDPQSGGFGQCTATILGPSVVLTARHCVSETDQGSACSASGKALQGGRIYSDHKANTMYVFKGAQRPSFHGDVKADGRGAKILHSGAKTLCDQDIALILLEKPIDSAAIAPIRLETPPAAREVITAVGWGVTDKTDSPNVRQQRTGIRIEELGPVEDAPGDAVGKNEFRVGESICSGDSGGPGLATETGAVLGVVSRGGNGTEGDPNDPSSQCVAASNLYTQVAPFKDLVLSAFEQVGEEPWLEGGPDPRKAKFGEECAGADACRSNVCVDGKCSEDCSSNACPDGYECAATTSVCVVKAPTAPTNSAASSNASVGSCALGAGGAPGNAGWLLALAVVAGPLVRRGRRRMLPAPREPRSRTVATFSSGE